MEVGKEYFKMSFRFDKSNPEDFGLVALQNDLNRYINLTDNSVWKKKELYDFGWGNENGFMRLPKLTFNELWYLITTSGIQENRYGAAYILEQEFSDEMLNQLMNIFQQQDVCVDEGMKKAFKILKLEQPINRSKIVGKNFSEIEDDFNNWKYISERVKKLK